MARKLKARVEPIGTPERKRCKWEKNDLAKHAKDDQRKVGLAGRLRGVTMLPVALIADRLKLETAGQVNNSVYRRRTTLFRNRSDAFRQSARGYGSRICAR